MAHESGKSSQNAAAQQVAQQLQAQAAASLQAAVKTQAVEQPSPPPRMGEGELRRCDPYSYARAWPIAVVRLAKPGPTWNGDKETVTLWDEGKPNPRIQATIDERGIYFHRFEDKGTSKKRMRTQYVAWSEIRAVEYADGDADIEAAAAEVERKRKAEEYEVKRKARAQKIEDERLEREERHARERAEAEGL